jgi:hypothetical protein
VLEFPARGVGGLGLGSYASLVSAMIEWLVSLTGNDWKALSARRPSPVHFVNIRSCQLQRKHTNIQHHSLRRCLCSDSMWAHTMYYG